MILWNICFAKNDVALRTNKGGVILLLLDLEIQGPSVICGGRDVTSISAPQERTGTFIVFVSIVLNAVTLWQFRQFRSGARLLRDETHLQKFACSISRGSSHR